METPNFYAIIPATVRYCEELAPAAKLLYGEITALASARGYCYASNSYFANLYHVEDRQVRRWLSQLVDLGFVSVKIDKAAGNQRNIYVKDALPLRSKKTGGEVKKDRSYGQKRPDPTDKKDRTPISIYNSSTESSAARAENHQDVEKEKGKKAPPIPGAPPAGPTGPTIQPATFSQSIWATATTGAFAQALHEYAPETADADAGYYRQRCRDWSAQNPNKAKPDWIAFAAQIIGDDRSRGKLVTIQPIQSQNGISSNTSSAGPGQSSNDNLVERAAAIADRIKKSRGWL